MNFPDMFTQEYITVADHLSDPGDTESSAVSESTQSEHFTQNTDDFDTALLAYGRSILESALDDSHDEDHLHENEIFYTKQKVRAQYDSAVADLNFHLTLSKEENRKLQSSISTLEDELSRLRQALENQEASSRIAYQKVANECWEHTNSKSKKVEKREKAEAQLSALKEDRKRKAEQKVIVWERAEKRRAE